jgi:hypothetical protein
MSGKESVRMASQDKHKNKRSEASGVGVRIMASNTEDSSENHTITFEDVRFRAYEIYLTRGSLPGYELDDWLQAELELDVRAPQRGKSTDTEKHEA